MRGAKLRGGELRGELGDVYRRQRLCLRGQAAFAAASVLAYKLAVVLLFAHFFWMFFFGLPLTNRAEALAAEKYPIKLWAIPGNHTNVSTTRLRVGMAKDAGDVITVRTLRFNSQSLAVFAAGTLGNIAMWVVFGW